MGLAITCIASASCRPVADTRPAYLTTMSSALGVPPKLLNEAFGHVITVELKNGQLFSGKLLDGALISSQILFPVVHDR